MTATNSQAPRTKRQATSASVPTTIAPATMGEKNRQKFLRAKDRMAKGQALFQMPNGQFKFGGNKFVADSVAILLIAGMEPTKTNRGWLRYAPAGTEEPT